MIETAWRGLGALFLTLGLAGCGTVPAQSLGQERPLHVFDPQTDRSYLLVVDDPFEGFNRGMYAFNAAFDEYVFLPVVAVYEAVLPDFVEDRVSDFFTNLSELRNAGNGLLQLRPEVTSRAAMRFLVNSTVGLLGLFDVAGELGMVQQNEDFGQTLGWWGVGDGPYLVLPVLGPSNLRDTGGLATDTVASSTVPPASTINEWVYVNPGIYVLRAVDERHSSTFRYYASGSPFEYDLVRFLYTKRRDLEIRK